MTLFFDPHTQTGDPLARIADLLVDIRVAIADLDARVSGLEGAGASRRVHGTTPDLVERARRHFAARRMRNAHFDKGEFFGEPGWDMLLDLFISQGEGRTVSVTAACAASGAPASTAMRWIAALEDAGLVRKESDPADRRRQRVTLTRRGNAQMQAFLAALPGEG